MATLASTEINAPIEAFRLQARLVSVSAGLHIVRYISAKDEASPPVILIQAMPQDAAYVSLLTSKEGCSDSLVVPGDSVVVRALRDVRVVATTASLGSFGAESAVIKIEQIDQVKNPAKSSMAMTASVDVVGAAEVTGDGGVSASQISDAIKSPVALQKELVRPDICMLSNC